MRRVISCVLVLLLLASCTPGQAEKQITVIAHPDGPLYAGDQVSFEVLTNFGATDNNQSVSISINDQELGQASFGPSGIGQRRQATLWWVWNTHDLKAGNYQLTFTVQPENSTAVETYRLHRADQVPLPEPQAMWTTTTSVCCIFHYITGTDAARDIQELAEVADEESGTVSAQLDTQLKNKIDVVIMSRVIGQGGFTGGSVYVSYLDSNYIGNDMPILFHHEFVHFYDAARGGVFLPSMFEEGLAVYLSGGHFKPEPLMPRAAALIQLGWYIPLTTLANDFYNQQHDISYLEAGSLIEYMVETYGWDQFNQFYRNIQALKGNQKDADVIDAALQADFGISFRDLEANYLAALQSQVIPQQVRTDLQVTITFYNAVRQYQQELDPSAYFLTAWLPDGVEMQKRGIVADMLRRPMNWDNQWIEALLISAHDQYFAGRYDQAESTLKWIDLLLGVFGHR